MRQIILLPGFAEPTVAYKCFISDDEFRRYKFINGVLTFEELVERLKGHEDTPIVLEPGHPRIAKLLKQRGFWVLK